MKGFRLYLLRFLSRKFIKFITEEDVLRLVNKDLYIGNSKMTEGERGALKAEAHSLLEGALWQYAKRNVEYLATMKMGKLANNRDDIFLGNAMFLVLNTFEEFLTKISKL